MATSLCATAALLAMSRGQLLRNAADNVPDSVSAVQATFSTHDVHRSTTQLDEEPPRRIQYVVSNGGGLSDCLAVFIFLNSIAHFHNATAHIPGGVHGASRFMSPKHSAVVAQDWDAYFDTNASQGNPFHPIAEAMSCKNITDPHTDWYTIFDDGVPCVNILKNVYTFDASRTSVFHDYHMKPQFSSSVKRLAKQALQGVNGSFGCLHVRRCDRMTPGEEECTKPSHIRALVSKETAARTWLVFTYAEEGYLPALQAELALAEETRFVYEEAIFSQLPVAGDNYLVYATMLELLHMASKAIDIRQEKSCAQYKTESEGAGNVVADRGDAWELRGVCSGPALGSYHPSPLA